jgi:hypothetical protein
MGRNERKPKTQRDNQALAIIGYRCNCRGFIGIGDKGFSGQIKTLPIISTS